MYVKDTDLGYKRIIKNFRNLGKAEIKAGVLANAGRSKDDIDLVDIAIFNEYGTKSIPQRPFLRLATERNQDNWDEIIEAGADAITLETAGVSKVLGVLGNRMVNDIQAVIGDRSLLVANAPSTIKQKKSDVPLIDSGRLRQSIDFEVKS